MERGQFFNELSTEETHALFASFAAAWNARKLPARFYRGISDTSLRRTKHAWGIRGVPLCRILDCSNMQSIQVARCRSLKDVNLSIFHPLLSCCKTDIQMSPENLCVA